MPSSFAASTCRTALAPFRQGISDSSDVHCDTPDQVFENVGAVGFEPTNPSLVRRVLYH